MEFFEVLEKRYSCRDFKDEKIKREELNKILEAGRLSPTAVNFAPQKVVVVESEEMLAKLATMTHYTFNAKTIIITLYDKRVSWHRKKDNMDHGIIDAAIVTTNMMNACAALGIGSCFVCSMHADEIREALGFDENYVCVSMLPIGYPNLDGKPRDKKPIDEIVSYK